MQSCALKYKKQFFQSYLNICLNNCICKYLIYKLIEFDDCPSYFYIKFANWALSYWSICKCDCVKGIYSMRSMHKKNCFYKIIQKLFLKPCKNCYLITKLAENHFNFNKKKLWTNIPKLIKSILDTFKDEFYAFLYKYGKTFTLLSIYNYY